ncbi:MAG: nuclease-related domain-containing protein [Pseudomonadota bacterium]
MALPPLLFTLLLGWKPIRLLWRARRRQRLISGYGVARLNNVVLEDGIGGHKVLEHILLTPDGLLVLLPRDCDGALFGGDKIDSWTQMVGNKSFHFENPLHQLDELLAILHYHLPGIPVEGQVLFRGHCRFPKGRPERLLLLEEMVGQDRRVDQAIVPVLEQAWQKLQGQPRAEKVADDPVYAVSATRLWLAAMLVLLTVGWLGWRLL